ncbi:MAG: energy transducer TonB [Lysobacterales bacterium]
MQILRVILITALSLGASLSIAASPPAETWLAYQRAQVTVAADGTVQQASLLNSSLSAAMQEQVLQRIRAFEFEPATHNGVAGVTETTLSIKLAVEPEQDQLVVRVVDAEVTVGFDRLKPPRFPMAQLRRAQGARVELRLSYDGSGRVTDVSVESVEPDLKAFRLAALKAAREWQFQPERVDGIGIAGSALIPVTFSLTTSDDGKLRFPDGGTLRVRRQLEPPERLLTSTLRLREAEG